MPVNSPRSWILPSSPLTFYRDLKLVNTMDLLGSLSSSMLFASVYLGITLRKYKSFDSPLSVSPKILNVLDHADKP